MPVAGLFLAATVLATTYYVDASRPDNTGNGLTWETAKKTINAAAILAAAGDGHEVVVTNGIYPVSDGMISLSRRNTILRSVNGPEVTIIQGTGSGSDNIALRFTGANCGDCTVSGFTFTNVQHSGWPTAAIDVCAAGGAWLLGSTLEDCVITRCGSSSIRCADIGLGCNMTLRNCRLRDTAGVVLAYYQANTPKGPYGRIEDSELTRMGLIYYYNYISNSLFEACNNTSYGPLYTDSINGEIYDSRFMRNRATAATGDGGAVYINSSTNVDTTWVIRNCLFAANQAERDGGALYLRNTGTGYRNTYIESCTFVANRAVSYGGAVNISGLNNVMFVNSIAYSNLLTGFHHGVSDDLNVGAAKMTNSCYQFVTPGFTAVNCITSWPQFMDFGAGCGTNNTGTDFRLYPTSPCINAGIDQPWMTDAVDLAGNPRLCGPADMGAYEYKLPHGTFVIFRGR